MPTKKRSYTCDEYTYRKAMRRAGKKKEKLAAFVSTMVSVYADDFTIQALKGGEVLYEYKPKK